MKDKAILIAIAISLAGHVSFVVAGNRISPTKPAKHLIDIKIIEKPKEIKPAPKPPAPKPIKLAKQLVATKHTGAKPSQNRPAPKIFGVDKSNTAGDVAVAEGNSLLADPLATPQPSPPPAAPKEEEQKFWPTGECDSAPVPRSPIQAVYPDFAKTGHIEGKVILELDIDASGKVVDVRVLKSSHPCLSEAAIEAVRHARFIAAVKDGDRVAVTMRYPFTFSLSEQ